MSRVAIWQHTNHRLGCAAQYVKSLNLDAHVSPPLEDGGFDKGIELGSTGVHL